MNPLRRALLALVFALLGARAWAGPPSIEAIVLEQGYSAGFGGAITLRYKPRVLFSDGSYTADAATALQPQPRIDGRWKRDGDGWTLTPDDGKDVKLPAKMLARPATPGATLEGAYRSLSGVGNVQNNVPVVAAWKNLQFARDGSVRTAQGAGSDDMAAYGHQAVMARYRLDGYTMALTYPDGRTETRLFYFFPDSDTAIGLGGDTLSLRR